MITAIVGHRGTGKSQLMKRLQLYLAGQEIEFVDLDLEIESKAGKSLRELFLEHGESYFREMERQLFLETLQKAQQKTFIVVGAGFDVSSIPETVRVIWARRVTDLDGRIFLDRPRLNASVSPLEEYEKRAITRESHFAERADEIYLMPEGIFENHHRAMAIEKSILTQQMEHIGGAITVLPEVLQSEKRWSFFKERFAGRGVDLFEIRDDLLTLEQIDLVLNDLSEEKLLFSVRKKNDDLQFLSSSKGQEFLSKLEWVDWPLELGNPDEIAAIVGKEKLILSLHDRERLLDLEKFSHMAAHLKYAPLVESFSELEKGHRWQQLQPSSRSFLPSSPTGRWSWYRLLQKGKQSINFWKEGHGSSADQPSLWAWLMAVDNSMDFAAVLGDPVYHSYTPMEHSDFFYKKNMSTVAIEVHRDEWSQALPFLKSLGLKYAAVTAPHKKAAAELAQHSSLGAVNTLYFDQQSESWRGTSTDEDGFAELIDGVGMVAPLQKEIFVWGGGGTLEMIRKLLPHASLFSARTGQPREGCDVAGLLPKIVIWAAPRTPQTMMPPQSWQPSMVFDLNYKEDSMGREYAQACGANYESGLRMFIAQAQKQRVFWRHCEEKS